MYRYMYMYINKHTHTHSISLGQAIQTGALNVLYIRTAALSKILGKCTMTMEKKIFLISFLTNYLVAYSAASFVV